MNETCGLETSGDGIYIVVNPEGDVLQPDGTFGDLARSFKHLPDARAARPGPNDRVIFASQRKKFKMCGCLK